MKEVKRMSFETLFKQKIALEKIVVQLTQENLELKSQLRENKQSKILFADWMEKWLSKSKDRVKQNTYDGYSIQVNKHIVPYFRTEKIYISELTPEAIEDYYKFKLNVDNLSGLTIKKHHSNIKLALKDAVKNRIISYNPADLTDKPMIKKFRGSYLNDSELQKILNKLNDTPNNIINLPVTIAAYMGLRRSEVLGLQFNDIDYVNKTMTINHTITKARVNRKYVLVESDIAKTKSSHRTLPIPDKLFNILINARKKQLQFYSENRKTYNKKYLKYFCVDKFGNMLNPDKISKDFSKFMKIQGYNRFRFHDLRHTCASLLIKNCKDMQQMTYVSKWLGHSSIQVTNDIYVHLYYEDKIKLANAINKYL